MKCRFIKLLCRGGSVEQQGEDGAELVSNGVCPTGFPQHQLCFCLKEQGHFLTGPESV